MSDAASLHAAPPHTGWVPIKAEFLYQTRAATRTEGLAVVHQAPPPAEAPPAHAPSVEGRDSPCAVEATCEEEAAPDAAAAAPAAPSEEAQPHSRKRTRDEVGLSKEHWDQVCQFFAVGKACPYGEKCRASHDLEAFLRHKPADIGPVCPFYVKTGYCRFGYNCRFLSGHSTGRAHDAHPRLTYTAHEGEGGEGEGDLPDELNTPPRALLAQLRKKKYPYRRMAWGMAVSRGEKQGSWAAQAARPQAGGAGALAVSTSGAGMLADADARAPAPAPNFRHKIYVAPLTTVGNMPFRRVLKSLGADITVGEMAMARNLTQGQASEWALLKRHESEDVFGVQIAGGYADDMVRVAELIDRELGGEYRGAAGARSLSEERDGARGVWGLGRVSFVDINMGCPIDCVTKVGAGSALMRRTERVGQIVKGMTSVMHTPLTLKMRTGWDTGRNTAHKLILQLAEWRRATGRGVVAVTVHGRSREMRYTKQADWDYVASCHDEQIRAVSAANAREDADAEDADGSADAAGAARTHGKFLGAPAAAAAAASPAAAAELEAEAERVEPDARDSSSGPDGPVVRGSDDDDKQATEAAPEAWRVTIIGNGDVMSFTDWNRHVADPRIETCMIGRGSLIKPWVCTEIKEQRHIDISASERLDMLRQFVRFGLERWGSDERGVALTRRFLLEWMSFLCRYVPVGLMERVPQHMNDRPRPFFGRNDLETLMASPAVEDWVRISEMLLGPAPPSFSFRPKHRANAYAAPAGEGEDAPGEATAKQAAIPSRVPLFGPLPGTLAAFDTSQAHLRAHGAGGWAGMGIGGMVGSVVATWDGCM